MAKKKFDTNPLDPDFPAKAAAEAREERQETQGLPYDNATKVFEEPAPTVEQETRKFDGANFNQYQMPYNGQNVPLTPSPT